MDKPDLLHKNLTACFRHALKYMPCKGIVTGGLPGFDSEDRAFQKAFSEVFVRTFSAYPHEEKPLTRLRHEIWSRGKNKQEHDSHPYRLALGHFMILETMKNPQRPFNSMDHAVIRTMSNTLAFDMLFKQRIDHYKKEMASIPGIKRSLS